jgi:hypothetical protein
VKMSKLDLLVLGAYMARERDNLAAEKLFVAALEWSKKRYGSRSAISGLIMLEIQRLLETRGAIDEAEMYDAPIRQILVSYSEEFIQSRSDKTFSNDNK